MGIISIIFPVLMMMVLGKILGMKGILDDHTVGSLKKLIADIMLPVTLFDAILQTVFDGRSLLIILAVFILFTLMLITARALRKHFGEFSGIAPYLCVSIEGGMMGYALYTSIYGSGELGNYLKIDLGNIFFAFTVFLFMIKTDMSGSRDLRKIFRGFITSPIVIAVALGFILSLTGVGQLLISSGFYQLYSSVVGMVTAPMGALVLLTVGYGLEVSREIMGQVIKVSALRLLLYMLALVAMFIVFREDLEDARLRYALILAFFMPGQFITPVYVDEQRQLKFVSTQLSFYSLISIAAFIVISIMAA